MGNASRVFLVVLSVSIVAGFSLARWLEPSPTGRGTHRQLGLPACTILTTFRVPCPACGMTTSFSHFVRGQWSRAINANASGFVLALICLSLLPWAMISLVRNEFWLIRQIDRWLVVVSFGWLALVLLEWGWNFALS